MLYDRRIHNINLIKHVICIIRLAEFLGNTFSLNNFWKTKRRVRGGTQCGRGEGQTQRILIVGRMVTGPPFNSVYSYCLHDENLQ